MNGRYKVVSKEPELHDLDDLFWDEEYKNRVYLINGNINWDIDDKNLFNPILVDGIWWKEVVN